MNRKKFGVGLLTVLLIFSFGCGDKTEKKTTPEEVGKAVAAIYTEGINKVVEMLKDKPDASGIIDEVKATKEDLVTRLVELGKKRDAFDKAGKDTVDRIIRNELWKIPKDTYKTYQEISRHYVGAEEPGNELHLLIGEFNVITQYAIFELLKKQKPAEATRLGIE